jgi:hypothetical protein
MLVLNLILNLVQSYPMILPVIGFPNMDLLCYQLPSSTLNSDCTRIGSELIMSVMTASFSSMSKSSSGFTRVFLSLLIKHISRGRYQSFSIFLCTGLPLNKMLMFLRFALSFSTPTNEKSNLILHPFFQILYVSEGVIFEKKGMIELLNSHLISM